MSRCQLQQGRRALSEALAILPSSLLMNCESKRKYEVSLAPSSARSRQQHQQQRKSRSGEETSELEGLELGNQQQSLGRRARVLPGRGSRGAARSSSLVALLRFSLVLILLSVAATISTLAFVGSRCLLCLPHTL